ncbi:MAG: DUF4838 domain-containing protein, partial [Flavisolibacter sp.]|nr:DUF4838 domain-containing protein [Flavisolibacter sp.]
MKSHRNIIFTFLLTFFSLGLYTTGYAQLYRQTIYVDRINDPLFRTSLSDLTAFLKKITGRDFSIKESVEGIDAGIYFIWNKPGLVPEAQQEKLTKGTIEDFILSGNNNRLLIIAKHPVGFTHALYSYLDRLGVKWYFPGDEWSIVPSLNNITITSTEFVSPSFHQRNFFGTGSILPVKSLDPSGSLQKKWDDWKRRNRFGGEINPGGHYGEVFNLKHRQLLEQHPEYLALVNGKREWSVGAKWCVSNKKFRELFISDRVNELRTSLQTPRNPDEKIVVSVDPADGAGDCECPDCKKSGAVSDRYFLLANEVAKEFTKISPLAFANIYAYNTHAAPPPFKLNPNVIVQIIPYAFQSVGTPEEMIGLWTRQHNNLLMYDYYGLPDWHWDTPLTGRWSPFVLTNQLLFWKQQGIRGFMLESSYGSASAGLGLYLAGRLGWNSNESVEKLSQDFYKDLFGNASVYIANYYKKLAESFSGVADLPYLLEMLQKADDATKDNQVKLRLESLKAYTHYLSLYYQWQ